MSENKNGKHYKNTDNEDTMLIPNIPANTPQNQNTGRQRGNPRQQYDSWQQAYPRQQYPNHQQGYPQQQYPNHQQGYPQQQYGNQHQSNTRSQNYRGQQSPAPQKPQKPRPTAEKKHKKKKHKSFLGKLIRRLLLTLLIILLLLFGIYSCTSLTLIGKMNHVSDGSRSRTSGALSKKYVTSVLVIGTDGRTENDRGRSDSMILLSINSKTNRITMTSFLRDSYVEIPGRGMDKLNAAYAYGGPELLMDTIERNFNVKIDNYISINFNTFASIIDSAGGITMELSDEEAQAVNVILISEVNELMGDGREDDLLKSGGKLHLNGKQALSYSRIRSVGKWDFERTSRQRKVMTALIKKASSNGISFISNLTKSALPYITTNMVKSELYLLSLKVPFVLRYDIKQLQIPAEGTYGNLTGTPSGDVLEIDFGRNIEIIEEEVFSAHS